MRIPLNERRNRSKASQGVDVEGPDCLSDRGTMIVDQYSLAICLVLSMSSQMDLNHRVRRQRLKIQGDRILIPCNDVDRRLEDDLIIGS